MKRVYLLILISLLCVLLAACGDSGTPNDSTDFSETDNTTNIPAVTEAQEETSDTDTEPGVQQIGDFTVVDGALTAYTGTETEPVIPGGVVRISSGAFESSPAAGSIKAITLGKDVKAIDPDAFFGLSALRRVYVDAKNSAFCAEIIEYSDDYYYAFLYGLNEQIIFYFPYESRRVDDEKLSLLYADKKSAITFVCGNAVFDVIYDSDTGWCCRSVSYDGNKVAFEDPVSFWGDIRALIIFETKDRELVFEKSYYTSSDIYYITKNTPAAVELHDLPDRAVLFNLGDGGELRYSCVRSEFDALDQTGGGEAFNIITDRDEYYGEDGRVIFENGEFKLERENLYTISDYFKMIGTDIDTRFKEMDLPYDSLEQLMEENKKRGN